MAPKNGPKFKNRGPKNKKNNTQAGITRDGNELSPKLFYDKLDHINDLPKKWYFDRQPIFTQKTPQIPQKVIVFFIENWEKIGPAF